VYAHLTVDVAQGGTARLLRSLDARLALQGRAVALDGAAAGVDHGVPAADSVAFSADPWPCWVWRAGDVVIEKVLVPISGHPGLVVAYREIFPYVDLRVDSDGDPIRTLRRLWGEYEPVADMYVARAVHPDSVIDPTM